MSDSFAAGCLWLFVIFLGITFGAGLYERRIVVPRWLRSSQGTGRHWNPEAAREDDPGRKFWVLVTTLPLTILVVANFILAWHASGNVRGWWLTAVIFTLADRIFTFFYFILAMIRLMRAADSPESTRKAIQWANLNYVRLAMVLPAWLAALQAFSLFYQHKA